MQTGTHPHSVVPAKAGNPSPSVVPVQTGTHPLPSLTALSLPRGSMRHGWRCPPLPRRQRACPVLDTGTEVRVLLSRGFRGILFQTVPQQPHLVAEGPDFGTRPGAPAKHIRIEARRIRTEMRLAHGGCERGVHIARIARAFASVNDRPSFRRSRADGNPGRAGWRGPPAPSTGDPSMLQSPRHAERPW